MRLILLTVLALPALVVGLMAPAYAGRSVSLPPTGSGWDYQLGGARPVPHHVGIVERDRLATPAHGKYNICYVNGYQTQVEQKKFWHRHWGLVLKDAGKPVTDSVWGEWLLDIRTPAKRKALAAIMGRWTDRCARDGFDAVEYDNLDSFSRSHHLLSRSDNRRFAALLVKRAHADGLAAAQKNWAEWDGTSGLRLRGGRAVRAVPRVRVVRPELRRPRDGRGVPGPGVPLDVWAFGDQISVVRRDVDLTRHGVRRWC